MGGVQGGFVPATTKIERKGPGVSHGGYTAPANDNIEKEGGAT
jgi:hypothetical protein